MFILQILFIFIEATLCLVCVMPLSLYCLSVSECLCTVRIAPTRVVYRHTLKYLLVLVLFVDGLATHLRTESSLASFKHNLKLTTLYFRTLLPSY
jgi:hypothetical protein